MPTLRGDRRCQPRPTRTTTPWTASDQFRISVAVLGGSAVIGLAGELDLATVPPVKAVIEQLLADGHRTVILDLSALDFLDAAGLGMMVATSNRLAGLGGALTVESASTMARRLFHLCSLDHLLGIGQAGAGPTGLPLTG